MIVQVVVGVNVINVAELLLEMVTLTCASTLFYSNYAHAESRIDDSADRTRIGKFGPAAW